MLIKCCHGNNSMWSALLDALSVSCCHHLERWISKSLKCRLSENDILLNVCQLLSLWGIICSPQTGLKLMNDAAWKDLFRVQRDKLSQIDSEDHMSAGYGDILTGPRLYVSEKFYPASWWSSFFSLMRLLRTPFIGLGDLWDWMTYEDISNSGILYCIWANTDQTKALCVCVCVGVFKV